MNKYQIKFKNEQHTILSPKNIEEVVYIIEEVSKTTNFLMFKCIYQDTTYTIFIKPSEIYYIS